MPYHVMPVNIIMTTQCKNDDVTSKPVNRMPHRDASAGAIVQCTVMPAEVPIRRNWVRFHFQWSLPIEYWTQWKPCRSIIGLRHFLQEYSNATYLSFKKMPFQCHEANRPTSLVSQMLSYTIRGVDTQRWFTERLREAKRNAVSNLSPVQSLTEEWSQTVVSKINAVWNRSPEKNFRSEPHPSQPNLAILSLR